MFQSLEQLSQYLCERASQRSTERPTHLIDPPCYEEAYWTNLVIDALKGKNVVFGS